MSIPSRSQAAQILVGFDPPEWLATHCAAVADVAAFLARAIAARNHAIDVTLVEAAALLHDVDKAFRDDQPLKSLGHGTAGAAWAREQAHDEIAAAIYGHPVSRLADDDHYFVWVSSATVEERVVAYADKRAMQDVVSLDERFAEWVERHGDTEEMRRARERAEALEQEVCAAAGISPTDVRRAPWAAAALGGVA